jgi:uncharacterized protein (TIGR00266 family)
MEVNKQGGDSFAYLVVHLNPGEKIITESDAMASMDPEIHVNPKANGGFFRALLMKILGNESFFINTFSNNSNEQKELVITQPTPGSIVEQEIDGDTLFIQPGAFLAATEGIKFRISYAGLASFLSREGLFRLRVTGKGKVYFGAYGYIDEHEVVDEFIVDSGHLLSYPEGMNLKIKLSGGLFSSFFSGEGLVLKLIGSGKIKLQTRSIGGLAGWLNPKFWR